MQNCLSFRLNSSLCTFYNEETQDSDTVHSMLPRKVTVRPSNAVDLRSLRRIVAHEWLEQTEILQKPKRMLGPEFSIDLYRTKTELKFY